MSFGFEGEKVRLVPLREDMLENCFRWINDPEVTAGLLAVPPMSLLAEREWLERAMKGDPKHVFFAIETLEGEHIGTSGIHDINYRDGTANTGTLIGRQDLWGKGYGTDSVRVRTRYAFDVLGLRMLLSAYLEGNEASRRMQAAVGYVEAGRLPQRRWKNGQFVDEVLTYCTRETWIR